MVTPAPPQPPDNVPLASRIANRAKSALASSWVLGGLSAASLVYTVADWLGGMDALFGSDHWLAVLWLLSVVLASHITAILFKDGEPYVGWYRRLRDFLFDLMPTIPLVAHHVRGFIRIPSDDEPPSPIYKVTRRGVSLKPPWSKSVPHGPGELRVSCAFAVPDNASYRVLRPRITHGWGACFSGAREDWHTDLQPTDVYAKYRFPDRGDYSPPISIIPDVDSEWLPLAALYLFDREEARAWSHEPIDLRFVKSLRVVTTRRSLEDTSFHKGDFTAEAEFKTLNRLRVLPPLESIRGAEKFDYDAHPGNCFLSCTMSRGGGNMVLGNPKAANREYDSPIRFALAFHLHPESGDDNTATWISMVCPKPLFALHPGQTEVEVYWQPLRD